ncbi:MAG: hypothetical protein HC822_03715 [Oscillochloris sp.]|nr:hypothetical protein [Oscillochloris sp.]
MIEQNEIDFARAELLAADLAGSQVDANEAQKALAYLRSKRGDGKALFTYLQAVVSNGQVVVRSRRTIDYYRNLQSACERHLRSLQGDYEQLLATYAWSLQILRYYRAVPDAAPRRSVAGNDRIVEESVSQVNTAPPPAPEIPKIGDVFPGKILGVDDTAMLIEIPGFADDKALGVVEGEGLDKRYKVGNAARVEVAGTRTQKSGRVIVSLKLARKA